MKQLGMVSLLLLAGCAQYTAAPIEPVERAESFRSRSLDDPQLRGFIEANLAGTDSWPPKAWNFDTLTLAALYFHPALEIARARVDLADAQRLSAGERLNPDLQIGPQYNTTSRDIPAWILGTVLNFSIETAGKRGHRIDQARYLADAARFDLSSVAWQVRRSLRSALLELYAAEQGARLLKEQREQQQELVSLLTAEHDAGAISGAQVMRERILLDQQNLALDRSQGRISQARSLLAEALGVSLAAVDVPLSFDEFEREPEAPPADELRWRALSNRPDVLAALAAYAGSESALALEVARQYPDLTLGPGYEYDQGDNKWTLGIGLSLPILHRNQGPIAEAEALRRESAARFDELQSQVIGQLERASAVLEARQSEHRRAAELVVTLSDQERLTRSLHEAGELGLEAVLAAQLERVAGQIAELEARIRLQEAIGELEDATQTRMTLDPRVLEQPTAATTRTESE